jgi:preprotein translocase subunit YajC
MNPNATTGSMVQFVVMMVVLFAIMYFMIIRPQKKREKLTQQMLAALTVGDKLVTIGGIQGKITQIKDDTLVLETGSASEKSYVKVSRWAVKEVLKPAEA